MENKMNDLFNKILSIIEPKCYCCKKTVATRMVTYSCCLGESYLCDTCNPERVDRHTHFTELQIAKIIRNTDELNINTIINLLDCVYPKCNVCNMAATKEFKSKILSSNFINFCDKHDKKDFLFASKIDGELKDLPHSETIRNAIKYINGEQNES